jgi:galactokinase
MAAAATVATAATSPHAALKQQFTDTFGPVAGSARVHIIRAPGRVNLIGEHTDYNDGFVCPMAIEPQVTVACRTRDDGLVRLASSAFPKQRVVEFSLQQKIGRIENHRDAAAWSNYPRGVAAELIAAGIPLVGMDALFTHNLPVGGGLSSSAAMEISTGHCFLALAGLTMDPMRLALICQKAEHEYPRVPCGIMDQMIVASAQQGKATLFDCRELTKQFVSIDPQELRVVICNSMVKHALTGGEYAQRRRECEAGVAFFRKAGAPAAVRALRDVTMQQVEAADGKLDRTVLRRCRHVVSENARCVEAAGALDHRHYERAGELMIQSHRSLRDDYQVSCPELDFLADEAMNVKGVYGARMTGGGFGGCIVALCLPRTVEALTDHLRTAYQRKFNIDPTVFPTTATAGASLIE